ncbi:hypothetical protein [Shouchella lonarensis]|uniref:hypothetical protein n=1 Tax=Shouchella lonarensis TaxID=1464122 RepID=UPI00114D4722|nr:hypothetical protein [Shouchella lonarensis]
MSKGKKCALIILIILLVIGLATGALPVALILLWEFTGIYLPLIIGSLVLGGVLPFVRNKSRWLLAVALLSIVGCGASYIYQRMGFK